MKMLNLLSAGARRLRAGTKLCILLALMFGFAGMQSQGQSTVHITFEGPPPQPLGTGAFVQQYYESNMWFRPLGIVGAGNGFVRQGGGFLPYPENGTAYLQAALGNSLMFSFIDGALFSFASVDLAEYSTVVPDAVTVPFIGYRSDGSTVTVNLTTDGIIDGTGPVADFQTFNFGPEWSGLSRVEIPAYGWSLDNLIVSIPEPGTWALLLLGGALVCALRRRRKQ